MIDTRQTLTDFVSRPDVGGQVVRKRCFVRRTSGDQPKYRYSRLSNA
jgi:hypothetical protein